MYSTGDYLERIDASTIVDCVDGNKYALSPGEVVRFVESQGQYFKAELPNGKITSDFDLHMSFFKRADAFNQTNEEPPVPHVHADLIKAWAYGAKIQRQDIDNPDRWIDTKHPSWDPESVYRLAPKIVKIDATVQMIDNIVVFGRPDRPGLAVRVSVNTSTNKVVDICKV